MHVHNLLILLLMPPFGVAGIMPEASTGHADAQLSHFITQLGSNDFKERQAASQALDALGSTALEALHKASQAQDPEVRRRAESLARVIEKRVETAQLLEAKHVRLVYDETPVGAAIKDFAQKSGFPIHLVNRNSQVAERRITLDTGDTTFWEAFDQFCEKAGLVERVPPPEEAQVIATRPAGVPRRAAGGQVISSFQLPARNWDGQLILEPGKEKSCPTCTTGAVRVRALSARGSVWGQAPPAGETIFVLEVTPQPKMAWYNIETRVDRAIDDSGQNLTAAPPSGDALRIAAALANGAVLWDAQSGRPWSGGMRQLPVRLKLGDKPTRLLKEVEGVVLAQVQTPPKLLLSVDRILKAAGQVAKDPADGKQLKVQEVKTQANGTVVLRLQLEDPAAAPGMVAFNRRGVMRVNGAVLIRNGVVAAEGQTNATDSTFALLDTNGQSFQLESRRDGITANGNALCWETELTYRPHDGQTEAAKLVYSGRRWVVIEVPFALRDVPVW